MESGCCSSSLYGIIQPLFSDNDAQLVTALERSQGDNDAQLVTALGRSQGIVFWAVVN